jgi:protoporphyrinogen IX oxidase
MLYNYLKALHIIFIVTWFAGMFYMPRLFIYATEANDKDPATRDVLQLQFNVMMRRLWFGITWPSAVLTLVLGPCVLWEGGWWSVMAQGNAAWLIVKLVFVVLLYAYHFSIHSIYKRISTGQFLWSSSQLRIWNEVATVFLFIIVILATVKESLSFIWGLLGVLGLILALLAAIKVYKRYRKG